MRDRQEVVDRYIELRDRYLKERKEQYLGKLPINCSHNVRLRVKGKGQLGFCQNPQVLSKCGPHKMFLCNEPDTAQRCRVFNCRNTEVTVEAEMKEIMGSPARCGNDYPKLAMLIWFLQEDVVGKTKSFWKKADKILWKIPRLIATGRWK